MKHNGGSISRGEEKMGRNTAPETSECSAEERGLSEATWLQCGAANELGQGTIWASHKPFLGGGIPNPLEEDHVRCVFILRGRKQNAPASMEINAHVMVKLSGKENGPRGCPRIAEHLIVSVSETAGEEHSGEKDQLLKDLRSWYFGSTSRYVRTHTHVTLC